MQNRSPEIQLPPYARLTCILISLVIIVYGLSVLQETLVPLVFAVMFSAILFPLCRRLEQWGVPRVGAILICITLALAILYGLFYLISIQIGNFTQEGPRLLKRANQILDQLQRYADTHNIDRRRVVAEVRKYLNSSLENAGTVLTSTLLATTNTLSTIALLPLFIFFFLLYRDFFKSFFYKIFGHTRKTKVDVVFSQIYTVVKDYLVGLVLVIIIVGILNTVGLLILGVDYAVFFGFFGAFMILIPYVGIAIGSVLPALFTLGTHPNPLVALGVVGVFLFVQVLEGNFITPYIVGSKVSINPLAAIIVLILWGQLWGLPGLILALPLTAILKVLFDAVDDLKPYGFLLGEAEKPRPPIKNIQELTDQLPERVRRIGRSDVKK
ncbi:AI-2E family transporter [Rudanella paleaurantiibacter]|uniref:AI-2E family transporter n=1 Tax=Rudanella paleaurantiibacter TaxID=2614655 RepID=A0A7J5U209_9BACT|nr:AI-2E family transporter [Rudanella paleaurantiibacter]KAB7731612.1 AI-2E family transporter [Rudanella paleaurantiibacter]